MTSNKKKIPLLYLLPDSTTILFIILLHKYLHNIQQMKTFLFMLFFLFF